MAGHIESLARMVRVVTKPRHADQRLALKDSKEQKSVLAFLMHLAKKS